MMRIAILTHGISPFGFTYARVFAQHGHQTQVFSMTPCEPVEGVAVRIVGPPDYKPWQTRSRLPYLKAILPVRRAIAEVRPDILLAMYLTSAGVLACLSGHPHLVISARGSDVNAQVGRRLWRAIFRWESRRADLVHVVSEPLAETLRGRVGINSDKLLVCPIGVDSEGLSMIDPARRPNSGQILCTRAHKPVYDQATLVRATARLKARGIPCHVTFAHTDHVEVTRQLVCESNVKNRVTFVPGYGYAELPSLMQDADVYVSCSRSDGTSSSLLEALSTGTFPVVTDIPANRPWVEHGCNGFLFPVGDDAALADRLAEALSRPDLRAAAALLNRRIVVERGDVHRQAEKLLAAFEKCLQQ